MLTILYIIPTLDSGGAERQLQYLLKGLNDKNINIHLCILKRGGLFEKEIPDHVTVHHVRNYRNIFSTVKYLKKVVRENGIGLIHTFLPAANFYGALVKKFQKEKLYLIGSPRSLHYRILNKWTLINYFAFRIADLVIANSNTVRKNCLEMLKLKESKVVVIPNGIPRDFFIIKQKKKDKIKLGLDINHLTLLSIGRFDRLKGHHILVDAAIRLLRTGLKFYLIIIGEGPEKAALREKIKDHKLGHYIRLLDKTADVKKYYEICDVAVLATFSEGFSNVILEAMAAGLLVITTSIPSNQEILEDQKEGILVPKGDVASFMEKIEFVYHHRQAFKHMERNAQAKVKRFYSISKMTESYRQCYLDLAGR